MTDLYQKLLDRIDEIATGINYWVAVNEFENAVRAIVELHAPRVLTAEGGGFVCPRCYDDPHWPCSTVRTIAEHLGIKEEQ